MFPTQALSIRAFRNLWLGQAISQVGDAFYFVVFMFMVKKITGSAAMVGVVGAADTLPYLLAGAYAGVLADRIDRRRIMLASDLVSGAILLAFSLMVLFSGAPPVWALVATPFLLSMARVFFMPAKSAAIPVLVREDMLMQANALSNMTQTFMPLIGLAMSASVLGVLYSISREWFFLSAILVNAGSFLFSAGYIRLLPAVSPERKAEEKHPWVEFRQGLGYIRRHPVLRVFILVSTLMNLMISPFFVVYVESNAQWFGGKPQLLCLFEFTFFLGMVVSSGIVARFSHKRPGLGYIYSLVIVGLAVAAMAYSRTVFLFCLLNLIAGLALPFCDIPLTTYLQLEVEDGFRGRVNSVLNMARMGVMPMGMVMGAALVQRAGLVGAFLVMGLGMSFAAALGALSPAFRAAEIRSAMPSQAVVEEADPLAATN